ncbi:MAG: sodium:solute symporter family protein [Leptospiraceae bacterium]|nr:sodium:solute symporter family protein [Leptospiraceae bacterium]
MSTLIEDTILNPELAGLLLLAFSALWIFLGWYWGRKAAELEEFMLAGRRVGLALGTATAMATWVTASTTMVAPQFAYELGIWGMIGYSLGSVGLLLFAPMARRIREIMPGGFTSGDFVRLRYGPMAWRIFLLISIFYSMGWLVSLGMAGGVMIEALSGLPYWLGMSVILTICVIYTLLGGLRAVIGTDFIQTLIIITGVVVLGFLIIANIGFDEMHESIMDTRPELMNLMMPAAIMFLFNNLLFGMGEIFHSNVWWSRAFAFGKGVGFKAYLISGIFWTPIPIAAGFLALAAPALNLNVPRSDMVGPLVSANLIGTGGAILIFIIVFSALASSLDSLLAATSDLIVEDIYHKHLHPSASKATRRRASSFTIILLGVVTWMVCIMNLDTLGKILHLTGAFVASTIWPIAAGLYWKKTNRHGAAAGMFFGSSIGLSAYYLIDWYVAALIGATVSMLIVVISTFIWPHDFRWEQLAEEEPGES